MASGNTGHVDAVIRDYGVYSKNDMSSKHLFFMVYGQSFNID